MLQVVARDAAVVSQREYAQLFDDPAMEEVRKLRRELENFTTSEIRRGMDEGVFRNVDVELAVLQLWGSMQWMWVWFDPAGSRTPEEVGAAFVDVYLGGLLLDRLGLNRWADPQGPLVIVVRECLAAIDATAE